MYQLVYRLAFTSWALMSSLQLIAAEDEKEYPFFSHNVDFSLLWVDELKRPVKGLNSDSQPSSSESSDAQVSHGSRAIGLEHLKIGLAWQFHQNSRLQFILRPDASLARGGENVQNRQIDTRAGDVYKESSPIQLLDSYQAVLVLGAKADLAIGVWDEIIPYEMSYKPLLAYGLQVRLPEYFSGLKLNWGGKEAKPNLPGQFHGKLAYELFLIQGDNDRSEQIGGKTQAFEQAPVAADPYLGGSARLLWWPLEGYRISLLFGYGEEGTGPDRSKVTFGDVGLIQQLSSSMRPVQLNWNARYYLESFTHSVQKLEPVYQFSFSGTASIWVLPEHRFLMGAHIGRSERHSSRANAENLLHYGHQMDLGWDYQFASGLSLQFMLSEEHREILSEDDDVADAFRNDLEVKKMLRRFAIAIQYQVDQGL
ncbi:MAG: hypothetical protein AB8G05_08610 [Oligoflexales bacterium]